MTSDQIDVNSMQETLINEQPQREEHQQTDATIDPTIDNFNMPPTPYTPGFIEKEN